MKKILEFVDQQPLFEYQSLAHWSDFTFKASMKKWKKKLNIALDSKNRLTKFIEQLYVAV